MTRPGTWKKGQSGNPKGRPPGRNGIEKLIGGIDVDELRSVTECEVRERFRILNEAYGWFDVVLSQEGFPDFILRNADEDIIRAEVETESRIFIAHGHDVSECDLIICWRHNWGESPVPVLTLSVEWVNYVALGRVQAFCNLKNKLKQNGKTR